MGRAAETISLSSIMHRNLTMSTLRSSSSRFLCNNKNPLGLHFSISRYLSTSTQIIPYPQTRNRPRRGDATTPQSTLRELVGIKKTSNELQNIGKHFDINLWDADRLEKLSQIQPSKTSKEVNEEERYRRLRRMTPVARHVYGVITKHKRWCRETVEDLENLTRVTPNVASEVIRNIYDYGLANKFLNWNLKQKKNPDAIFTAYMKCMLRNFKRRYETADNVIETIQKYGRVPLEEQFETLITAHIKAGRSERVLMVYRLMHKHNVKPSIWLCNKIIASFVHSGNMDSALEVFEGLKDDGHTPTGMTYMLLIRGLCRTGDVDKAFMLLAKLRERICIPDLFAYTSILRVLVEVRNLRGAWRFWMEMNGDRVKPDDKAYCTMILGLCEQNVEKKAQTLLQEANDRRILVSPQVYGALIRMYCRNGKARSGFELLKEMVGRGYVPDLDVYDSVIEGFCKEGFVDNARKLLQRVMRRFSPKFSTIRPIMMTYSENSDMKSLSEFLKEMAGLGLKVKDHVSEFISCLVFEGDSHKAVQVFEALKKKGCCSLSTYNRLISGLSKARDFRASIGYFEEMKDFKCEPDATTFDLMIPCYVAVGNLDYACSLFCLMKKNSWLPSLPVYSALIDALCKIGEIYPALILVKDSLGCLTDCPASFKQAVTVFHACKKKTAENVMGVLADVFHMGIPFEGLICCSVISGFCKYRVQNEAQQVFRFLEEQNIITASSVAECNALLTKYLDNINSQTMYNHLKSYGLEHLMFPKKDEIYRREILSYICSGKFDIEKETKDKVQTTGTDMNRGTER